MIPFRLIDATSAAHVVALLQAHQSSAQPIAAGGDLLGLLKEGVEGPTLPAPRVLVNLATARDLAGIGPGPSGLRIGAMTTLVDVASHPELPSAAREAVGRIASPQLRARTTLGGNLLQRPRCWYFRHPDILCFKKGGAGCPAIGGPTAAYPGALLPDICHAGHPSDLAPLLIALEAEAELLGPGGPRQVQLHELYQDGGSDPWQEARLGPAEILTAIHLPRAHWVVGFEKIAPRRANEFAWASAAVAVEIDDGEIARARIALGGLRPAPYLWRDAEAAVGRRRVNALAADQIVSDILAGSRTASRFPARVAACEAAIQGAIARVMLELASRRQSEQRI